jgi:hypothetical protein
MRLVSARCGGRVLDPFAQQSGEGSRILKRRQVPGVWPVDAPGTGDPGDHTPGGVMHCVQVEPAYQGEHGNGRAVAMSSVHMPITLLRCFARRCRTFPFAQAILSP